MQLHQMSVEQIAERFEYLDELRESGVTNMFGAAPYVERKFGHDYETAKAVLGAWLRGPSVFETTPGERAEIFVASESFLRFARAT